RGDAALALIERPDFRHAWRSLHQSCPWSTAFQASPFADTWYRSYRAQFAPVVVAGWADATLTGLVLLAISHDGTRLCHVGAQHAEYQVWPSTDARFAGAAPHALAAESPTRPLQLLHVTAMRVDDELVAAHIGVRSRNTVLVGMPAQSPRYARHSAGKLLFFELALLLEQEGVDALDLTPGGEYKDRFATRFDEASTLTVVFSRAGAWRHRQQRRLIDAAKRRGVSTDSVKRTLRTVRHTVSHLRPATLPLQVARRLKRAVWDDVELRIYRFPSGASMTHPGTIPVARDRFEDLACSAPAERW